jgi:hypothetical protein
MSYHPTGLLSGQALADRRPASAIAKTGWGCRPRGDLCDPTDRAVRRQVIQYRAPPLQRSDRADGPSEHAPERREVARGR